MSQKPSVLVVDDESGILDTLRILLRNEGFEVTTAQGGKAGLEALKGTAPDIVLTDVRMPQVGGIDILTAVRQQDPQGVEDAALVVDHQDGGSRHAASSLRRLAGK